MERTLIQQRRYAKDPVENHARAQLVAQANATALVKGISPTQAMVELRANDPQTQALSLAEREDRAFTDISDQARYEVLQAKTHGRNIARGARTVRRWAKRRGSSTRSRAALNQAQSPSPNSNSPRPQRSRSRQR